MNTLHYIEPRSPGL